MKEHRQSRASLLLCHIERPAYAPPGFAEMRRDIGATYLVHGLIGWLLVSTGPAAIVLSVGLRAGLNQDQLATWIFGIFFLNGLLTIFYSWLYRRPLAYFWTVPGTIIVGPALHHLSYAAVTGVFYAVGILLILLSFTGWVRRLNRAMPMPIVMGMVAGIFLRFGLDLVHAVRDDPLIAGMMALAWVTLSASKRASAYMPPIVGVLIVGSLGIVALGRIDLSTIQVLQLVHPAIQPPAWSLPALTELVLPVLISVLFIGNGQAFALITASGHEPPVNSATLGTGIGSILAASVGAVSTCLTGPPSAVAASAGEHHRHYIAGMTIGVLSLLLGLLAPGFTRLMVAAPQSFVAALAGLAMLRVVQSSFVGAFRTRFTLGAVITFLVTVADIKLFNIGAAFWGLVAGTAVSWVLERDDFKALYKEQRLTTPPPVRHSRVAVAAGSER